ncbi:MAG: FGGY-family carbohydrate kinase [Spirochaetota bacterium]
MSYMGLDIGQTGCKAAVFDLNGRMLSSSYREYQTLVPRPGWAEINSKRVAESCFEVMKEAQNSCPDHPVRGLGISSQGEAFTPVGSHGSFLGNAMITFDKRASEIMQRWCRDFGLEKLYRITGHTAHPMFSLFKLQWIRENRRAIFDRAEKFLCFEDLVQYCLGLEPCIALPLAGRTMMFNVMKQDWDDEILEACGVSRLKLARPLPSGRAAGMVCADAASKLGFSRQVVVAAGGHDQPMGAIGAGVASPGDAMYAMGTSEAITPVMPGPVFDRHLMNNNLCTYNYILKDTYTTVAFSLTGGNLLKWFRDQWGQMESLEAEGTGANVYDIILERMSKNPSNLLALPYFTPTGTPYFDTEATGAILGLNLSTTREEVLRTLLEGVAFEMRLNLDLLETSGIPVNELRAIGGGAKNENLVQLKADVLNKLLVTVQVNEAACLGGAMLACSAVSGEPVESLAQKWVKKGPTVDPMPENAEVYHNRFDRYKQLYPALKKFGIQEF